MRVRDSRRGGVLMGLLIVGLVFACLIVGFGIYVANHVRVVSHDRGGGAADVSIDLPGGHLSVRAHDNVGSSVAGVPVYPGARPQDDKGGNAVFEWSSDHGGNKGFAVSASNLVTDDPVDKVADYYRKQLPSWIFETKRNGEIHMEMQDGGYKRIITIQDERGRTHIGVATVGEPASN